MATIHTLGELHYRFYCFASFVQFYINIAYKLNNNSTYINIGSSSSSRTDRSINFHQNAGLRLFAHT